MECVRSAIGGCFATAVGRCVGRVVHGRPAPLPRPSAPNPTHPLPSRPRPRPSPSPSGSPRRPKGWVRVRVWAAARSRTAIARRVGRTSGADEWASERGERAEALEFVDGSSEAVWSGASRAVESGASKRSHRQGKLASPPTHPIPTQPLRPRRLSAPRIPKSRMAACSFASRLPFGYSPAPRSSRRPP